MIEKLTIGVVGLGYVGLVTAAVLASRGYKVFGVDVDEAKIAKISEGKSPIFEPGLEDLIKETISKHTLKVSSSYEVLRDAEIVFITVGTPSLSNGEIDLSFVFDAVENVIKVYINRLSKNELKSLYPVITIKSTVIPGTAKKVASLIEEEFGLRVGEHVGVVSNPEFLREGKAIEDTLSPSRVIIGEVDKRGADKVESFWKNFYKSINVEVPILRVPSVTAEMIKYASNAFLALKISFANLIARICEQIPGCDIVDVVRGMGLDPRINPSFLGAGLGYGGSCLPKDLKALIQYARKLCVDTRLLEAIEWINNTQPEHILRVLEKKLETLKGKVITILGVAFKPNTDDIRESKSIELARLLLERGAKVRLHDPNELALLKAAKILGEKAEYYKDIEDALKDADAAIIATAWDTYRNIEPQTYLKLLKRPLVLDARRIYDPSKFLKEGVEFYAVGLGVQG